MAEKIMFRRKRSINKVLVIRNDKLGDFMLALPSIALLKHNRPDLHVSVLVPEYTKPVAEAYEYVDGVVTDVPSEDTWEHARHIRASVQPHKFDASITLFSKMAIALGLRMARIPFRLAPATKPAMVFYNHLLLQRRSKCRKPEYVYNCDLAEFFLKKIGVKDVIKPQPPYLRFPQADIDTLKTRFMQDYHIGAEKRLIFVHPGHGGSASNLSVKQFATLIELLKALRPDLHFVVTAGPKEINTAKAVIDELSGNKVTLFESKGGLVNFAKRIAFADCFISGSTGPLHIAGVLNRKTAAFYPRRRSANLIRWQTPNQDGYRVAISPPEYAGETDLSTIDMKFAAREISRQLLSRR